MKLPICEMFVSVQGEGIFTGVPSFFIRTSGCNLRCCFRGSICDTPYSSFNPEKSLYETVDDVVEAFENLCKENPNVKHLVITGGEPLLHRDALQEFISKINNEHFVITIETNGTLEPLPPEYNVELYSVSPKLSTSVGNAGGMIPNELVEKHNNTRINIPNLCKYALNHTAQFKFVYSGEECVGEILNIYANMGRYISDHMEDMYEYYLDECDPNYYTMLMPEGITNEQLSKSSQDAVKVCIEKGWQFCDRMHIRVFGDKRGV